jgi:hypothetical protein
MDVWSARVVVILAAGALVIAATAAVLLTLQPDPAADHPAIDGPAEPRTASTPPSTPAPARPAPADRAPARAPSPAPIERAPTTGTLRIESDVPDTSVCIDRKYFGTAPITVSGLAPGTYAVRLVPGGGFDAHAATIEVRPGEQDYAHSFKTSRLDARVEVVHKHGAGSCRGTLIATPQGLTSRTDHEDDGFTAALTGIDVFAVDYLRNNLQVQVRGGRTYNFEDPDGNADRIFVFHRDVEKVRQRLIGARPPARRDGFPSLHP